MLTAGILLRLGSNPAHSLCLQLSPGLAEMAKGKAGQSSTCFSSSRARAGFLPRAISCLGEAEHCYYPY